MGGFFQSVQRRPFELPCYNAGMASKSNTPKCESCGGSELIDGSIIASSSMRFTPNRISSFWKFNGGVELSVRACMDCGRVHLVADTTALQKLING